MGFADRYIKKNRGEFFFEPAEFLPFKLAVVIPCFNESELRYTLYSLFECENPGVETAVVVVVNSSENSSEEIKVQNRQTISELCDLSLDVRCWFHLFAIDVKDLPDKHSGVGWARKIGMDWAIVQFNHFENPAGIIISLDADSLVERNYLKAICEHFSENQDDVAATVYFEHRHQPHEVVDDRLMKASVEYELYMRYYRNALLYTGFPVSIYTIGSCFAVKAGGYVAQGGMNRRKAGEDFYFLHKMAVMGKIGEINTTAVYPSIRLSNRVPFGTGPALMMQLEQKSTYGNSYPLVVFGVLKDFFSSVERFYRLKDPSETYCLSENTVFVQFCKEILLAEALKELAGNCGSDTIFKKRFFHLFNAFNVLKWLNYSVEHGFSKTNILTESVTLLQLMGVEAPLTLTEPEIILKLFRTQDKSRTIH
ncbi:MAG TPA: glycosyltransferase [Prolixibacteraceae bacterium]|nr:glycosyltransferase [Prolixibacteraceae bacterium]